MARARNIKPAFFKNEILGQADPFISLLFISLWTLSDREGRLEDRPLRIKAETFPYREVSDFNGYLTQLEQRGFIERYKVGDLAIIQIVNFRKHQAPHNTEKLSELPEKPMDMQITVNTTLADDELTQAKRPDSLIPDSLTPSSLIPDSRIKANVASDAGRLDCPAEKIIEAYHRLLPNNPRCKVLNPARRSSIKSRWLEAAKLDCEPFGYSTPQEGIAAWEAFFEVCADSEFLTGRMPPQNGYPVFFADVDFLFSPKGFAKCLENKYHRGQA